MEKKVAIITGITGQDGSYLAQLLLKKGYTVVGITRGYAKSQLCNFKYLGILEKIILEEADLLDFSSLVKLLVKYRPDEFYNLAAQSSVGISFEQPISTINYNTQSLLNILETIRLLKLDTKVYQASSSEMYGRVKTLPVTSETSLHPLSPYAISKASAYWIVNNYRESYNIYCTNGVLFNHESYLRSPNFFIRKVIRTSLEIKKGITKTLRVGNIDIKRDFGYAPDYVETMWLSLQQPNASNYLICSGSSILLRDVINHVFDHLNIRNNRLIEDSSLFRPTDIQDIYGDNSKVKAELGWEYNKSFYEVLNVLIAEESKNL